MWMLPKLAIHQYFLGVHKNVLRWGLILNKYCSICRILWDHRQDTYPQVWSRNGRSPWHAVRGWRLQLQIQLPDPPRGRVFPSVLQLLVLGGLHEHPKTRLCSRPGRWFTVGGRRDWQRWQYYCQCWSLHTRNWHLDCWMWTRRQDHWSLCNEKMWPSINENNQRRF